jgi:ribosomal protein L37AE/L43A
MADPRRSLPCPKCDVATSDTLEHVSDESVIWYRCRPCGYVWAVEAREFPTTSDKRSWRALTQSDIAFEDSENKHDVEDGNP